MRRGFVHMNDCGNHIFFPVFAREELGAFPEKFSLGPRAHTLEKLSVRRYDKRIHQDCV